MTRSAGAPLRRVLGAPFTRRAWDELAYTVVSALLAVGALLFIVPTLVNGLLWGLSAPGVRKLNAASRFLACRLLGEDVPASPRLRSVPYFKVRTPHGPQLAVLADKAGAKTRVWDGQPGVTIRKLPQARIAELAAEGGLVVDAIQPVNAGLSWLAGRVFDPGTWRARAYFAVKAPLAALGLAIVAVAWLGGLYFLTAPAWRELGAPGPSMFLSYLLIPVGVAKLLAAPWLVRGTTETDRRLIRGLLGPSSPAERIRTLEESRARVVDDSAARLRDIERDLHDGTQAQLVALAMKLGLAQERLHGTAPVDLARITQLVDDAHRRAVEAIAGVRTLARGIHPAMLDNGLTDALATLAARSAVPVELVTDIPERPSAAIETIAYYSASELLANVAKHSGARHATLEAVHVAGLLRIRVTDDGRGGAVPVPGGGLIGLAERVRTVDGRIDIDSPAGGPTAVTVELPSHA
ncbi:MAG TPA: sensor domain-containing protein [Streptosporangiaceae bacterium]|nr:sensor domain-containing protein [Streptosporangiaceae bacterium]